MDINKFIVAPKTWECEGIDVVGRLCRSPICGELTMLSGEMLM
jgi:hypothetical protein